MADAMKLGDQHTAIMDAIHGDLLRQNPGAFVEEDGNATLVIPTKPFLTIDVSALAESVLPLAASPPAREEAPTYADELVNASMRRRDVDFGREEAPAEGAGERERMARAVYANRPATMLHPEERALTWDEAQTDVPERIAVIYRDVDAILALRNRTSEPEAGAVAWRAEKGKQTYLYDTDEEYRMHSARSLGFRITPLYTHPAPATADKLRAVVEGFVSDLTGGHPNARKTRLVISHDALSARIDQALATLNEGGE